MEKIDRGVSEPCNFRLLQQNLPATEVSTFIRSPCRGERQQRFGNGHRTEPAATLSLRHTPISSPEAPDWPAPMLAVAFKANKTVDVRRRRDRTRPERLGREIPLGHRDLPITGIAR